MRLKLLVILIGIALKANAIVVTTGAGAAAVLASTHAASRARQRASNRIQQNGTKTVFIGTGILTSGSAITGFDYFEYRWKDCKKEYSRSAQNSWDRKLYINCRNNQEAVKVLDVFYNEVKGIK